MTTFYVATLARYVLVDAANEVDARKLGASALHDMYADLRTKLARDVPILIRTVRPATSDEIEMHRWLNRMIAAEQKSMSGFPRQGDHIRLLTMHKHHRWHERIHLCGPKPPVSAVPSRSD